MDGSPAVLQGWRSSTKHNHTAVLTYKSDKPHTSSSFSCPLSVSGISTNVLPSNRSQTCIALSLIDITQPIWLVVNCHDKLLSIVFCEHPSQERSTVGSQNHVAEEKYCFNSLVSKFSHCFDFVIIKNTNYSRHMCYQPVQDFIFLLYSIAAVHLHPFWGPNNTYLNFNRYLSKAYMGPVRKQAPNNESEGYCVNPRHPHKLRKSIMWFVCRKRHIVHTKFMCDTKSDCFAKITNTTCQCNETTQRVEMCKHLLSESRPPKCGPLYNQTIGGACETYTEVTLPVDTKTQSFKCADGSPISVYQLDDLVIDCYTDGRDEAIFASNIKTSYFCQKKYQIPCRDNHPRCYNMSQICKYILNPAGFPEPCRTGEHIEECENVECDTMFKCAGHYCIHWKRVCDGNWDCPLGTDEAPLVLCGKEKNCALLFKCAASQVCVHLDNLCDGVPDCPLADDESHCSLKDVQCPDQCHCLTFAVLCTNIIVKDWRTQFAPFHVLLISNSKAQSFVGLSRFRHLHFISGNLALVCEFLYSKGSLELLNIAENEICKVGPGCFGRQEAIKMIELSRNLISVVPSGLFSNLPNLVFINLSSNPIHNIELDAFHSLAYISLISFLNVTILSLDKESFRKISFDLLETNKFWMCCLLPTGTACSVKGPWYFSCTDLLPNVALRVVIPAIGFSILFMNCFSAFVLKQAQKLSTLNTKETAAAFSLVASFVILSDLLCSFPLCGLWIFNVIHQGNLSFIANEWQASVKCAMIFGLFVLFSLGTPLVLSFFAFVRLQVVENPITTRFKSTNVLLQFLVPGFIVSFSISLIMTVVTWLEKSKFVHIKQSLVLCYPFVDLTDQLVLIKVVTSLVLTLQLVGAMYILVVYFKLFSSVQASKVQAAASVSKHKSNTALMVQIVCITSSNILCWIPSNTVHLVALVKESYSLQMVFWTAATIYPLNSLVNPAVFSITSLRKLIKAKF